MLTFSSTPPTETTINGGTVDANITNASIAINGDVGITSGTVDANITNAAVPVSGTVTADISGPVTIQTATGTPIDATVSGPVDANITNANIEVTTSSTSPPQFTVANASLTVAGSVDANITNAAVAVQNTSGGSLNVAGTVNASITNANIEVTTSSTSPPQFTVANASIPVSGTVSIGGTPTVNISAGQVVQVENTSSGSLTVAGTVDIGNTPSVSISGTPTVNIAANQVVEVQNPSGTTLAVSGSVDISNTPAVSISGTPNVAISSGTVDANITNAAVPVSGSVDATIQNASLTVAGSVDIGTIAAGQVIEVINSPGAYVSTQSVASSVSNNFAPAAGTQETIVYDIPSTPNMHGALVSGTIQIPTGAAESATVTITGATSGIIYYQYTLNVLPVNNPSMPEQVIALSSSDSQLNVAFGSGGTTAVTATVNINFYSQAIPPDPYLLSVITQGLFDTNQLNTASPINENPYLWDIKNSVYSSHEGISIADALAPADTSYYNIVNVSAGQTVGLVTFPSAIIMRSVFVSWVTTGNTGRVEINLGNWVSDIYAANQQEPQEFIRGGGVYVPSGVTMSIYSDNADQFVISASYTVL